MPLPLHNKNVREYVLTKIDNAKSKTFWIWSIVDLFTSVTKSKIWLTCFSEHECQDLNYTVPPFSFLLATVFTAIHLSFINLILFTKPKIWRRWQRSAPSAVTWKLWIIRAVICLHSSCVIRSTVQMAVLVQPRRIYEEQTFTRCADFTLFQDGCMFINNYPAIVICVSLLQGSALPLQPQFSAWSYFCSRLVFLYLKLYTYSYL